MDFVALTVIGLDLSLLGPINNENDNVATILRSFAVPAMIDKGSSINDVTRFWGEIDSPSPLCHTSSQIREPPLQNDVTCLRTPRQKLLVPTELTEKNFSNIAQF